MADDQQNPFTMMGMMQMMQPNKFELPQFKGGLSMPGFRGPATDARGNVIPSFADAQAQHDAWQPPAAPAQQGTTLNRTPSDMMALRNATLTSQPGAALAYGANFAPQGSPDGIQAMYGRNFAAFTPKQDWSGNAPAAPAAASAPSNPIDMRQAYLDALANPGHVTTPGATVQEAQPLGTPSVLDTFLKANPSSGGQGAGGYSNQPFFDTLAKLRSA